MSISNGVDANATNFNAAFASKSVDNTFTGLQTLNASGVANGGQTTNVQRELSAIRSVLGLAVDQVYNFILAWANNNIGTSSSTVKNKIDLMDAEFADTGRNAVRSGNSALGSGVSSASVTFSSAWADANYVPAWEISNTVDASPIFLQGIITAKTAAGFTVTFNAPTDSVNYVFSYQVRKAV